MDIDPVIVHQPNQRENNKELEQVQHVAQHQTLRAGGHVLPQPKPQPTDFESTHDPQTPVAGEYDEDDFRLNTTAIDSEGLGHQSALGSRVYDRASSDDKTITSATPRYNRLQEQLGGEGRERVGGGQRKLSIQDLIDTGTGRPPLHSSHSSPASNDSSTGSPRYRNWPLPPSTGASVTVPSRIGDDSPLHPAHPYSPRHSPVPFPPPRSTRDSRIGAPSKRPGPISIGSSPFPYSSIRNSARASASPYPQATPVGLTPVGRGINMDNNNNGNGNAAASPPLSGAQLPSSSSPGRGTASAALAAGFTSPGGGSMSSANRRGAIPTWPSPKKKEVRSASFGVGSGSAHPHSLQTPREWYAQTPTVLRVPPTAAIQSPSTPVFIPGSARRPGAGVSANSAPVIGTARRVHLSDVPKSKVINALNSKAREYWFSPETSDCRICGNPGGVESDMDSSPDSAMGEGPRGASWPPTPDPPAHVDMGEAGKERMNVVNSHIKTSTSGRRGSMPEDLHVPVLVFPLHRDYLIIQSTLLRTLLSTTSIDMALRTSPTRAVFPPGSATSNLRSPSPGTGGTGNGTPQARSFPNSNIRGTEAMKGRSIKGARILPPKEGEPVSLFLPLPDPASFGVILHWLYWGDVSSLESALSRGMITWQGIVKNIEYLSLDDSIKRVMGKWWRTWVKTDVGRARAGASADEGGAGAGHKTGRERGERGVSVSASSEGGDGDVSDDGDEEMQVDREHHGQGRTGEEEDGVSHLLEKLGTVGS